jgi:DNA-binding NarL/FixJ family response regulator
LEVITQIKGENPHVPILVLTMHEEDQYVVRAIETGAMGYITKQSAPEQLVKAIRKVHSGALFLTDEAAEALALRIAKGSKNQSPLELLSTRELQVLRRLALGNTNREIAEAYHISIKTVDTYRFRLLKKLNLRNNADLSRFAIQNRLIET